MKVGTWEGILRRQSLLRMTGEEIRSVVILSVSGCHSERKRRISESNSTAIVILSVSEESQRITRLASNLEGILRRRCLLRMTNEMTCGVILSVSGCHSERKRRISKNNSTCKQLGGDSSSALPPQNDKRNDLWCHSERKRLSF